MEIVDGLAAVEVVREAREAKRLEVLFIADPFGSCGIAGIMAQSLQ